MKQKKIDLLITTDDDAGRRKVYYLSEHVGQYQKPKWIVKLEEPEFMELSEVFYAEYCRMRRQTGARPLAGRMAENAYYISVSAYIDLAKNMDNKPNLAEVLRRLVTSRGSRLDLERARDWAAKISEHGFVALADLVLDKNNETH